MNYTHSFVYHIQKKKYQPTNFKCVFSPPLTKVFETHAVDYLLKPFNKERFDKAIQKARLQKPTVQQTQEVLETASQSPAQSTRIVVKDGGNIKIIPISQVQYLEAADDYVKIHTTGGSFLKKKTMQYFEESLQQQQFIRIHRSYIINSQLITRIDPFEKDCHQALLSTGVRLPVSKAGYARLKEVLGI